MSTFLFNQIIFGPVWSRRLGESLGVNLLPPSRKVCNFNCLYCECGLTPSDNTSVEFPDPKLVTSLLESKLTEMKKNHAYLDSITFAGNGEPTLHPQFAQIIEETVTIRNRITPDVKIAVLSNASLIGEHEVFNALLKADVAILKLDSAIEETLKNINCPKGNYNLTHILHSLKKFNGHMTIQTLFFRGTRNGKSVDNTTEEEIAAWIAALREINPENVMIYSLARDTAVNNLEHVSYEELNMIAQRLEKYGIQTQVTP